MVYFYESLPEDETVPHQIIVGKDKYENDLLIKYGYRELQHVWFHVDKYSSAHVYLKLHAQEKSIDDVSRAVLDDCLQLCKANSIQGNKLPQCSIIITPWYNLRKSGDMKPGEVAFKSNRACKKRECYARDNGILNRLTKTKIELADNVEGLMSSAKKSKLPTFFEDFVKQNKDDLIGKERQRKLLKKQKKKAVKAVDEF